MKQWLRIVCDGHRRSKIGCRSFQNLSPTDSWAGDTIAVVRLVEAQYENGVLRTSERLSLRPGERVNIIVVLHSDPGRWDLVRLANGNGGDLALAEQGLADWAGALDAEDRS